MLITEFLDNEHMSSLESFVLQMNNSSTDSKFTVLANLPLVNQDPLVCDKVIDLLKMCEVDFQTCHNNKQDFDPKNVKNVLKTILKDNVNYKIEEFDMTMALGALNAAMTKMSL